MDRRSWLLLLALSAIWGASYMLIEIGIRDLSPAMVAWSRITLATVVLVGFAAPRGALQGLTSRWRMLLLVGAVQVAGPFLLISAGQQEVTSSVAGILVASAPLFTAFIAPWVDHEERSQGLRLLGVILGFIGVVVLLGVDLSGSGKALLGGFAILIASLGYAIGGFLVKGRLGGFPPLGVAALVMAASALLLTPAALSSWPDSAPGAGPAAAIVALGLVGTGLAFAIYYELFARVGPARTFVVAYLIPAFAVAYGVTLLDEALTAGTIAGLALILAGSWLAAEGRLIQRGAAGKAPRDSDPLPARSAAGPAP